VTTTSEGEEAMDATARAELDALRRRAYSSDADIAGDPVASARLEELEDLLRAPAVEPEPAGAPVGPRPMAAPEPTFHPRRPAVRPWHAAIIAVAAATAMVLGAVAWEGIRPPPADPPLAAVVADALAFASDPEVTLLYTVRLDGAFNSYADPYPDAVPALPIDKPVWASSLGEYYGYDLWVAGSISTETAATEDRTADGEKLCIVLADASTTLSRCVTRDAWEQGALVLAVGFDDISPDQRPPQMAADQSVGLWWTDDDRIRVLLGRAG
jgi:hypothetical protein